MAKGQNGRIPVVQKRRKRRCKDDWPDVKPAKFDVANRWLKDGQDKVWKAGYF